jgi:serine/threonine-protein kinase TTK/MPS1
LKPANFILVKGVLKLIDFGIAKPLFDFTSVQRTQHVGTLNYMSPEAISGTNGTLKVGRPSDIWALGIILYQMVFGTTPFHSLELVAKLNAITNPSFTIITASTDNIPEGVATTLHGCLERDPSKRMKIQDLISLKSTW